MPKIVPGSGNPNAQIMVVGEAPAATEEREGKPFVGRAGEELSKMLQEAGIDRREIYITNVSRTRVTCQIKKDHFFNGKQLTPAFIDGIQALIQDVQRIKPNVIIPMGNFALYALMGYFGVMDYRGSILWSPVVNTKVVPTIHPAALIRGKPDEGEKGQGGMYKYRNPVIWDLQRAKAESQFPELRLRTRNLVIDPKGSELDSAVERLLRGDRMVFDIESWGGTKLACIGFSDGDPEWAVTIPFDGSSDRKALYRLLLESNIPKYGQNLMYDTTMLDQNEIYTKNVRFDSMIAQHTLLPDLPKSLAFMASIYTDIPYYKEEGKVWAKPRTPELELQYYRYNAKDVCANAEIAQRQEEWLTSDNLWPVFQRKMNEFEPLRQATGYGFRADVNQLRLLMIEAQQKCEEAQKELDQLAGEKINVNSHVQVKRLLYEKFRLSNSTQQSSAAPVILDIAARTGHSAPHAIVKVREQRKLLSNYYKPDILSRDGRIRFGFNPVGTFGARISSSAPLWGPGLNGQNIPATARKIFVPDPGHTLLEFDQAQAEAVIVAYLASDPVHMDCFRNGKDVHRVTACLLQDMPPDDWKQIPKPSAIRELAKTCNHELNYNAGPSQFMMTVNEKYDPNDPNSVKFDLPMATLIRRKYLDTRPALEAYWESIAHELKFHHRTLVTPLGRRYQFLDSWGKDLLNKAYSYKPQCTVGETTGIGMCQVLGIIEPYDPALKKDQEIVKRAGVRFMLQVHDSTIWQVPNEAVDEVWPSIMRLLEVPLIVNGYHIVVPIEGAKSSKSWYKGDMEPLGMSRNSVEVGYESPAKHG